MVPWVRAPPSDAPQGKPHGQERQRFDHNGSPRLDVMTAHTSGALTVLPKDAAQFVLRPRVDHLRRGDPARLVHAHVQRAIVPAGRHIT